MDHRENSIFETLNRIEAALANLRDTTSPVAPGPCGRPIPTDPDAALFEEEAAELEGVSVRTLQAKRVRGGGPEYFKVGRSVRYTRRLLLEHRATKQRRSTSDPGSGYRR